MKHEGIREQSNIFEQTAHRASVALKIGVGALAVREVLQFRKSGESLIDYAQGRARDILRLAKPVAIRAATFIRGQIYDYLASYQGYQTVNPPEDSPIVETGVTAQTADHAETEEPLAVTDLPEILDEPVDTDEIEVEGTEPSYDLAAIFTSGEDFVQALNDPDLPEDCKDSMQKLVRAWRLADAVPQASLLWTNYVQPVLEEVDKNMGEVIGRAVNLLDKVQSLSSIIEEIGHKAGSDNSANEQKAFVIYEADVRRRNNQYDEAKQSARQRFEEAASDYDATVKETNFDRTATFIDLHDQDIAQLVSRLVANDSAEHLSVPEAEQIIDRVLPTIRGDITLQKVDVAVQEIADEFAGKETAEAGRRRQLLTEFFAHSEQFHIGQLSGDSAIATATVLLRELDEYIKVYNISEQPKTSQKLAAVRGCLTDVARSLQEDVDQATYAKSTSIRLI